MTLPKGWRHDSEVAIVNTSDGDIISKTFDGTAWHYEAHCKGGKSRYRFVSMETALAWIHKQREYEVAE